MKLLKSIINGILKQINKHVVTSNVKETTKMSYIKIKCKCEFDGVEYNGVVAQDGVNITVSDACDPQLGKVVTFGAPSPVLMVAAITSVSVGEGIPAGWLVLSAPATDE